MNIPPIIRDIWILANPQNVMDCYRKILNGRMRHFSQLDLSRLDEYENSVSIWIASLPGFCDSSGFIFNSPPIPACARQWLNDSGFKCIDHYYKGGHIACTSIEWANPNQ